MPTFGTERNMSLAERFDLTIATPQSARMSVAAGYQATMSLRNGGQPMEVPPLP
jgi:hypothetical protein